MPVRFPMTITARQMCDWAGLTPRQVRYWDATGLLPASIQRTGGKPGVVRLFSFRDLVTARAILLLLDQGWSLQRIRKAFAFLTWEADLKARLLELSLRPPHMAVQGEVDERIAEATTLVLRAILKAAEALSGDQQRLFYSEFRGFQRSVRAATAEAAVA